MSGMSIQFATCDRGRALGFLRKLYPNSQIEDAADSAGPVLEFVARDVIRIGDPDFHSGKVFASNGADAADVELAIEALRAFHAIAIAEGKAVLPQPPEH